ncbi:hypothetical protein [Ruminococcus sp. 5_1_39BFAA]|uniref:MutS-related protein n=1 Tax=Ruminococcus sp. 5_1_39BFAA TaxID=457412 RepID=UPI003567F935
MNPYMTVIMVTAGLILLFIIWIIHEERKRKKILLKKIRRIYGKPSERQYEPGDIENISHYFRRKCGEGFYIDDITWNDLDMDHVYRMVNQTISSPGEDVLYAMMRMPLFSQEEINERDKLIRFFSAHTEKREQMQLLLSKVGKTRLGSLSDTVLVLNESPKVSSGIHILMLVLILGCLGIVLPLRPLLGFFVLMLLCIANIIIYYAGKDRKLVEAYLDCYAHLLGMLSAADDMETVKWPEIAKQMNGICEGKAAFAGLRRKAVFLTGNGSDLGDILQSLLDYIRMVTHVDILVYNRLLREVQGKSDKIMQLLDNIGELDAAISIASFRELLALQCKPEFLPYDGKNVTLEAEDLYHPLLEQAVANCIKVSGGTLVTGSNASGKSTFLKNVAMNSILAQTICTCTCARYRAPFLKVMTSMALRDDLSGGESYFIVEIKSLKRILDESRKEQPLLCIIDEVLRGTNTIERIAASSRILMELSRKWVLPFAATHDIELSYILEGIYANYHFEEEVQEDEVVFSYILKHGRASSRNAIRLLQMLGYDEGLVKSAREAAENFERTGVWEKQ